MLAGPEARVWSERAPERYVARLETTEGLVRIAVDRALAPRGADRFYQLVNQGYYEGMRFSRVVEGYIAQFGVHGTPAIYWHSPSEKPTVS